MNQQQIDETRELWQRAKDCENFITQGRMDIELIGIMPSLLDALEVLRAEFQRVQEWQSSAQTSSGGTYLHCHWCRRSWKEGQAQRHYDNCPFKVLEGGDILEAT